MKRICVFCGASPGARPEYAEATVELARLLVADGIGVVYGGGGVGLMGVLADAVLAEGGEVIGVIPRALMDREIAHRDVTEMRVVGSMHERKALMAELSEAFVALPGGIGTLEELFEVYTWAQLGLHRKPCALLNVEGYFDGIAEFLAPRRRGALPPCGAPRGPDGRDRARPTCGAPARVRARLAAAQVDRPRGDVVAACSLPRSMADPNVGEILVQPDELAHRVSELAEQISKDYAGKDVLLIGVLKGAVFFLADLMRKIDVDCEVDFMAVSSYGSSTDSSGVVRILKDLDASIEGRHVLIVEDIVDSGLTLSYLFRMLGGRGPASLEVCALLTKPERREVDMPIRYVGFEIPNKFAIGYGLDHAERYRNLPYVAVLNEP